MILLILKIITMATTVFILVALENRYISKPRNTTRTLVYILTVILILLALFTILIALNNILP